MRKRLGYAHERMLQARRRLDAGPPPPRLWLMSAGRPRSVLHAYEARAMTGWPAGFWQTRDGECVHFVVIRDLPEEPETLLVRLLGRGATLQRAMDELTALPDQHEVRARALPVLVAFRSLILQDLRRYGDMNALQKAEALYSEWEQRVTTRARRDGQREGREQGERAMLVRLLTRRFGPLPGDALARIERADSATLERWAEQTLTAASLSEVLD